MDKKGNVAFIWIIALLAVFIVGAVYIVFTKPFDTVDDSISPGIDSAYQPTVQKIRTVWEHWPLLVILGIVVWAVMASVKESQGGPYY